MDRDKLIYRPNMLERMLQSNGQRISMPHLRYHTLYTKRYRLDDNAEAVAAYLVGGENCGCRYSVVVIKEADGSITCGSAERFCFPVPEEMENAPQLLDDILKACRGLQEKPLLHVAEIPGFRDVEGLMEHRDGWYTKSIHSYEYDEFHVQVFGGGARAFPLKEGVYVYFPDGSYRLIPTREFWEDGWAYMDAPTCRQGDLLAWYDGDWRRGGERGVRSDEDVIVVDRHKITAVYDDTEDKIAYRRYIVSGTRNDFYLPEGVCLQITHPEHDTKIISEPGWWKLILLPGTSRPYSQLPVGD